MKLAVYNDIVSMTGTSGSRDELKEIAKHYPEFSFATLGSISSQEYQKHMRKTHYKHYSPDRVDHYYNWYCREIKQNSDHPVLLKIAREVDLSPALLSRLILERYLHHNHYDRGNPPKSVVTQMMKEPALVDDPVLANQINICNIADDNYGPIVDIIKQSVGHEYECLLKRNLQERNLSYLDEDQLRIKGYDKTPDTKLEVPIAVDGHVVNWIESKASFGDEYSHGGYLKDQFWSYWNRFGPGLVIYWFGFIDELDVNRDKGILLMDHFPEAIVTMEPHIMQPK